MNRFFPGVIDYDGPMAEHYRSGRAPSVQAASIWVQNVGPFVPACRRAHILDLGCGTGRFSTLFAASFSANVVGIEPSMRMLIAARRGGRPANLTYCAGSAERIPLREESCDVVWLSQVWHHVRDQETCVTELRRILRPRGYVLVRGTFGDRLDGFPTMFHYWPAARDICRQLPTVVETVSTFKSLGFSIREHRRVRQTTCSTLQEFADRTQRRADSALALIPHADFWQGQRALEKAVFFERKCEAVVETVEMIVFCLA